MRICKSCGAEIAPGEKFCLECGSAADDAVETDLNENEKKDEIISKEADKEIKAVSEVLSEDLPKVKEINIIKPKDISVLKPKKESYAKKAPAPVKETPENTSVAAEEKVQKQEMPEKKVVKREIPDVELPDEPKAYVSENTAVDASKVVMKSFVSERDNEDFSKGFYSDVAKTDSKKSDNNPKPETNTNNSKTDVNTKTNDEKPKKKKSSAPIIIAVLVVIALACAAYFMFVSNGNNNDNEDDVNIETTTAIDSETTVTEETSLSETESEEAVSSSEESSTVSEETVSESETSNEEETTAVKTVTETEAETETETSTATAVSEETTVTSTSGTELTFTHTQSVSGSQILSYTFGGDNFSVDSFTDNSVITVTYTSAVSLSEGMSPITMILSDGTNSATIPATSADSTTVTYSVSDIDAVLAAEGFSEDIKSVTTMSFNGVGMPVDITAISIS